MPFRKPHGAARWQLAATYLAQALGGKKSRARMRNPRNIWKMARKSLPFEAEVWYTMSREIGPRDAIQSGAAAQGFGTATLANSSIDHQPAGVNPTGGLCLVRQAGGIQVFEGSVEGNNTKGGNDMATRILVPLDGSSLAEQALSCA
ncbi:MAG: hypothetical protein ACK2U2_15105, partial [Anaerolineae bacterium]